MKNGHESPREFEREAERTRYRLSDRLDELNGRLTPGHVLDEVMGYAKGGGGTFMRALSNAAKENPVPAMLIAAGFMMFLGEKTGITRHTLGLGGGGTRRSEADAREMARMEGEGGGVIETMPRPATISHKAGEAVRFVKQRVGEAVGEVTQGVENTARGITDTVSETARSVTDSVSETAHNLSEGAKERAHALVDGAQQTAHDVVGGARRRMHDMTDAASQTAHRIGDTVAGYTGTVREEVAWAQREAATRARQAKDMAVHAAHEQPLLVAAVGVALGAAIAAMLPKTEAEDRLMGEASDKVKDAMKATASEQYESAKAVAARVGDEALRLAEHEGLTPGAAAAKAGELGDKLKRVLTESVEAGEAEAKRRIGM